MLFVHPAHVYGFCFPYFMSLNIRIDRCGLYCLRLISGSRIKVRERETEKERGSKRVECRRKRENNTREYLSVTEQYRGVYWP